MPNTIQFRRGALAGLPSLSAGEPGFTTDQFRLYVGSSGGNRLMALLHNNAATAAPTVNDDAGDGYSVGSRWIDTTNDKSYVCVDSTVGSAIWQQTSGTGTGGITQLTGDGTAGPGSGSQALTLANSGVTAGSYGGATAVPVLTFDAKGRCTSATTAAISAPPAANVLRNSGMEDWQLGTATSSVADDSYYTDGWYVLTQTTTANVNQVTGGTKTAYALQLGNSASAQRMGIAQIVETELSLALRGRGVRFQFRAKASATTTIRFAILEWTGTANAVTSDVVNSWTSGTYTAGNFFASSNVTVTQVSSGSATTSWADFSVNGTLGSSCTHLIVFIWTESTLPTSANIAVTECGLYDGTAAQSWLPEEPNSRIQRNQRQFYKSYALTTAPGTVTDVGAIGYAAAGGAGEYGPTVTYPARMMATPTYTIYSTNSGASGKRFDASAGTDETMTGFNLSGPGSHSGANAAHAAGRVYRYHFTADARL